MRILIVEDERDGLARMLAAGQQTGRAARRAPGRIPRRTIVNPLFQHLIGAL